MEPNSVSIQSAKPEHVSTLPGRLRDRIRLVKKFPNIQSDVARALGLKGNSAVNHVIHKRGSSARIEEAIVAEINKRITEQQSKTSAA